MGKLSNFARKAVAWLRRARRSYDDLDPTIKVLLRQNKNLSKYFAQLEKIEQTVGAHTTLWPRVEKHAHNKWSLELDSAEVIYLYAFKRAFDKHLKSKFKE